MSARIISVFGPFNSRALVEMPAAEAAKLVPDGALHVAGPARVIDATEREIARIRDRDVDLADSALAASAIAMAYEIEHPFNSATSKSMCQARLADAMKTLRELSPPDEERDALNDIEAQRAKRLQRLPGAAI